MTVRYSSSTALQMISNIHAEQVLSDGSYLVTLHPVGLPDVQVRVIEYRIEPHTAERLAEFPASQTSNHPDPRQLHRLVTTLLDPQHAPALELILCYHERWEIEACIDEQKTHLRLSGQPLRSKDPALVRQELYGLLLAHYIVRWWMHQFLCWGCLLAVAITFPLVFGWIYFRSAPGDQLTYVTYMFGFPAGSFRLHTVTAWLLFHGLDISAMLVRVAEPFGVPRGWLARLKALFG